MMFRFGKRSTTFWSQFDGITMNLVRLKEQVETLTEEMYSHDKLKAEIIKPIG